MNLKNFGKMCLYSLLKTDRHRSCSFVFWAWVAPCLSGGVVSWVKSVKVYRMRGVGPSITSSKSRVLLPVRGVDLMERVGKRLTAVRIAEKIADNKYFSLEAGGGGE